MSIIEDTDRVRAEWWNGTSDALGEEPGRVYLEVERDESGPGRVSVHTMVNGEGSRASYYLDRESAIELAAQILNIVRLP